MSYEDASNRFLALGKFTSLRSRHCCAAEMSASAETDAAIVAAASLIASVRAGGTATSLELADAFISLYPRADMAHEAIAAARAKSLIAWIRDDITGIDYWSDAAWKLFALAFFATASFAKMRISCAMLFAFVSWEHSPYVVPTEEQIKALREMISAVEWSNETTRADLIAKVSAKIDTIEKIQAGQTNADLRGNYRAQLRFFERIRELLPPEAELWRERDAMHVSHSPSES